ncbi:MAG: hypothetical protein DRP65_07470 [Planctomycetota bacterium]|nr:MAG: hypothetical protein DRP65_07470 [Planctomycetota bacterium]
MSGSIFKYIAIGCFLYILWIVAQVVLVALGPFALPLLFVLPVVYLVIYLLVKMIIVILRCLFRWFVKL